MLKFYFNKNAFEALAKEFRRASWGAAVASAAVAYQAGSGVATFLGGLAWVVLQVLAFVLESIQDEKGDPK